MLNQTLKTVIGALALTATVFTFSAGWAQEGVDVEKIRWKSEAQVRSILGEPNSIHGPVGTHHSYTLWKYENYTVAFADKRAFHMFHKDTLKKIRLEENR
ncbi:MAG: hypothetical protein HKN85_11140 [Gammaproteobacteria bacterium]|nr:hypothetical protein [Gammaproteobacteria bacterium]